MPDPQLDIDSIEAALQGGHHIDGDAIATLCREVRQLRAENRRISGAWAEVVQREQRSANAHFHDMHELRAQLAAAVTPTPPNETDTLDDELRGLAGTWVNDPRMDRWTAIECANSMGSVLDRYLPVTSTPEAATETRCEHGKTEPHVLIIRTVRPHGSPLETRVTCPGWKP